MAAASFIFPTYCLSGPSHRYLQQQKRRPSLVVSAREEDGGAGRHFGGRLVDENMLTLRKRIHELRMADEEMNSGDCEAPEDWMEWERERRYHETYVWELMGLLQVVLLNTRPVVGLASMAALVLSLPASVLMILSHLVHSLR
ncbi:hypothetical protein Cni_G11581 [Canna indica]|uniref:Uncharacterized protein n=1 Tax=Canna indica TaxID=4628 RepID=A0AAQ3K6L3_9LILI|nr:hypothetical protein Cni_G11581 [Canna indica]